MNNAISGNTVMQNILYGKKLNKTNFKKITKKCT